MPDEMAHELLGGETQAFMLLPLTISEETIGLLGVGLESLRIWDIDDQHVLFSSGLLIKQSFIENFRLNPETKSTEQNQLSDFIFFTAHNLRHPVTNLMSLLEMLNAAGSNEDALEEVQDLLRLEVLKLDDVIRIMMGKLDD